MSTPVISKDSQSGVSFRTAKTLFEQRHLSFLWLQRDRASHRGAALVEVFILSLVMVPMLLTIPMIGKIVDLKQTTELASRYLAWEHAKTPVAGLDRTIDRFFGRPAVPIQTSRQDTHWNNDNVLWGRNSASSLDAESIRLTGDPVRHVKLSSELPEPAASAARGIKAAGSTLDFLSSVNWDITTNGMLVHQLEVEIEAGSLLSPFVGTCSGKQVETSRLCLKSSNNILIDSWSSGSRGQAESRSRAFVPAAVLDKVGYALSKLGHIPVARELRHLEQSFGYVDSTELPLGRYEE